MQKSLEDLAERYGLQVDPDARISDLSVGQQQRVEILKALYRNVELLILDEPTGVLTPKETEKFFSVLRKLKAEGYAVIIITHRMSEIMSISDRVTILRDGKKIKDLVTKDTNPTELSNYMIGRQLDYNFEVKETEKKEIALQLKDITVKKDIKTGSGSDQSGSLQRGNLGDCRSRRKWTKGAGRSDCRYPKDF